MMTTRKKLPVHEKGSSNIDAGRVRAKRARGRVSAIESTSARLACYDAAYPLKLEKPVLKTTHGEPHTKTHSWRKMPEPWPS